MQIFVTYIAVQNINKKKSEKKTNANDIQVV